MIILGINAYHADSSACLIKDGEIIAAVEEERFTRDKHWAGFPTNSIVFCLNQANLTIYDIDFILGNTNATSQLVVSTTQKNVSCFGDANGEIGIFSF